MLFVELSNTPRLDLQNILTGGDGLDHSSHWLAYAPHLDKPVHVGCNELQILENISSTVYTERVKLEAQFGISIITRLLNIGLLLCEDNSHKVWYDRDHTARKVPWWPPSAIAMIHGRWQNVDLSVNKPKEQIVQQRVDAFGPAPTHDYRRRDDNQMLPLDRPADSKLDHLLRKRETCRNFSPNDALSPQELSTMLSRVWGVSGLKELSHGTVSLKKNSPAGGGLHVVEAYLLVQRVKGFEVGLYHYLPLHHALEPIKSLGVNEARNMAKGFLAGQSWFQDVAVLAIMTARFDRLLWKYRSHQKAWGVAHLDVGHLSQTMYLSATELGLGAFVSAAVNDHSIEEVLNLQPLNEGVIALGGFGPLLQVQ